MYCMKCGSWIKDTESFCTQCGERVKPISVAGQTRQEIQQASYTPPQQAPYTPPQQIAYAPNNKPKNKKLIIGLSSGLLAVAILVVLLAVLIPGNPVVGKWVPDEYGLNAYIQFKNNGTAHVESDYVSETVRYNITYTDRELVKGNIIISGMNYSFILYRYEDKLKVDGVTFHRN